jgi:hypothetical protein
MPPQRGHSFFPTPFYCEEKTPRSAPKDLDRSHLVFLLKNEVETAAEIE